MRWILLLVASFLFTYSAHGQKYRAGEVIVKLRGKSTTMAAHAFIGKALAEKGMAHKGSFKSFNMHHFSTKAGQSVESAIQDLMTDPAVEYAEPNYILERLNVDDGLADVKYLKSDLHTLTPSGYAQPQMTVANVERERALLQLSSPSASEYTPVVAVIDTGVDIDHEVFRDSNAIWVNEDEIPGNGIDDDGNGFIDDVNGWNFNGNNNDPDDDDGHGTHVAGIVLGVGYDILAQKIVDSARIRIMPLKFLGKDGAGSTSDAIAAINYAVSNGADVLNNSWGGPDYSRALHDAVAHAYNKGTVFVAAAGNSNNNNDFLSMYPASLSVPQVMSIAATNDWDMKASFSNYGEESVDVGSPGVAVLSTIPNDGFGYSSGTSMAAPFVSGLAALMKLENPNLNGYEIKELVFQESDQISKLSGKVSTGSRINLSRSLTAAQQISGGSALPEYDVGSDPASRSLASTTSVEETGGGGCGMALVLSQFRGGGGPSGRPPFFGFLVLLVLVPLVVMRFYQAQTPQSRRRHERFHLNTSVTMNVNGRELVGQIGTISLGGVSLSTDALLENGGIVKMQIASPDGEQPLEVEGQVVWSEPNKAYGVQFSETESSVRDQIKAWTGALVRSN